MICYNCHHYVRYCCHRENWSRITTRARQASPCCIFVQLSFDWFIACSYAIVFIVVCCLVPVVCMFIVWPRGAASSLRARPRPRARAAPRTGGGSCRPARGSAGTSRRASAPVILLLLLLLLLYYYYYYYYYCNITITTITISRRASAPRTRSGARSRTPINIS